VLPVVSSAVFLSVGPSLVTIRFGSSEQLLSRGFRFAMMALMAEKAAAGRGRRKEKKLESTRSDQTAGMAERASTPLSVCLSDPPGRDEAVAQEGAQNSVKEGSPILGQGERAREPRGAQPSLARRSPSLTSRLALLTLAHPGSPWLARCECIKRHGAGET